MSKNKNFIIPLIVIVLAVVVYIIIRSGQVQEMTTDTSPNAHAKLNINVVCESSLSYMTFTDGASAQKFVAECKEGKHPEVIEHYKAQMNLGDGATI